MVFAVVSGIDTMAYADGIKMTDDGHFVNGDCYTLKLTKDQIAALESKRENGKLPFTVRMKLTPHQTAELQKASGKEIREVQVFEGKWADCSCSAQNIASRCKPDRIELCAHYLIDWKVFDGFDDYGE